MKTTTTTATTTTTTATTTTNNYYNIIIIIFIIIIIIIIIINNNSNNNNIIINNNNDDVDDDNNNNNSICSFLSILKRATETSATRKLLILCLQRKATHAASCSVSNFVSSCRNRNSGGNGQQQFQQREHCKQQIMTSSSCEPIHDADSTDGYRRGAWHRRG